MSYPWIIAIVAAVTSASVIYTLIKNVLIEELNDE